MQDAQLVTLVSFGVGNFGIQLKRNFLCTKKNIFLFPPLVVWRRPPFASTGGLFASGWLVSPKHLWA